MITDSRVSALPAHTAALLATCFRATTPRDRQTFTALAKAASRLVRRGDATLPDVDADRCRAVAEGAREAVRKAFSGDDGRCIALALVVMHMLDDAPDQYCGLDRAARAVLEGAMRRIGAESGGHEATARAAYRIAADACRALATESST